MKHTIPEKVICPDHPKDTAATDVTILQVGPYSSALWFCDVIEEHECDCEYCTEDEGATCERFLAFEVLDPSGQQQFLKVRNKEYHLPPFLPHPHAGRFRGSISFRHPDFPEAWTLQLVRDGKLPPLKSWLPLPGFGVLDAACSKAGHCFHIRTYKEEVKCCYCSYQHVGPKKLSAVAS